MKRFSLFFILAFFAISFIQPTHAQTGGSGTNIDVTIKNLAGSGYAKLIGVYTDQNYLADSALIDFNGHFAFKPKEKLKSGFFYVLLPNKMSFQMLVDDEHQDFKLESDLMDLYPSMKVTNSLDNELLYQNIRFQSELDPKFSEVTRQMTGLDKNSEQYKKLKADLEKLLDDKDAHLDTFRKNYPNTFFTKFKLAGQNPRLKEPMKADGTMDTIAYVYSYRMHFWDEVDFNDDRLLRTPVFFNKMKRYINELTPQNPDSLIVAADYITDKTMVNKELFKFTANYIALQYQPTKTSLMDGEAVFSHMILKYFTYEKAFWSDSTEIKGLRKQAEELQPSLLGKIGQDVRAKDVTGTYRNLYDLKSPLLVVFIYKPDCSHCREQTPKLKKLYAEWKAKGVDIFSIASTTKPDEWKAFHNEFQVPWTDVCDPTYESRFYLKYHIDNTPEIYLLNPERIIVAKNLNADQLPEVFQKELDKIKK